MFCDEFVEGCEVVDLLVPHVLDGVLHGRIGPRKDPVLTSINLVCTQLASLIDSEHRSELGSLRGRECSLHVFVIILFSCGSYRPTVWTTALDWRAATSDRYKSMGLSLKLVWLFANRDRGRRNHILMLNFHSDTCT